jgi:SpoIIAA-like
MFAMIEHELLSDKGVLIARPKGPLSAEDFRELARDADAYIETHGQLKGLIICAEAFPGWDSVDGFLSHFRFIRDHHRKIAKVAFVSDSDVLSLLPRIAGHFLSAEVRTYKSSELDEALHWMAQ